jgi:general secretion pathway protein B
MSSILKALRKLEEEKAAMGEGRADLARDILKRSAVQGTPDNSLIVKSIFFVVLALAIIAGLWLLLAPGEQATTNIVAAPVAAEQPVLVPAVPVPVQYQVPQPVKKQIATPEPAPVKQVAVAPKPVEVSLPVPEVLSFKKTSEPVPAEVGEVAPEDDPQPSPVTQQDEELTNIPVIPDDLPQLNVDAIMFKPKPGDRLAVINDFPVMEGTSIDGVQIVEIQEEGVRFSWQGMEFVLPLEADSPQ